MLYFSFKINELVKKISRKHSRSIIHKQYISIGINIKVTTHWFDIARGKYRPIYAHTHAINLYTNK